MEVLMRTQALTIAHYKEQERLPGPSALIEALHKIIMIGDPDLRADNRVDWPDLVRECFEHPKKVAEEVFSQAALDGLKRISANFEPLHLESQSFRVSGEALYKRRKWFQKTSTYKNCLCNAKINVREYTTSSADEDLWEDEGDDRICAFHPGSKCGRPLLQITSGGKVPHNDLLLASSFNAGIRKSEQLPQLDGNFRQRTVGNSTSENRNSLPNSPRLEQLITDLTVSDDHMGEDNISSSNVELLRRDTSSTIASEDHVEKASIVSPISSPVSSSAGECSQISGSPQISPGIAPLERSLTNECVLSTTEDEGIAQGDIAGPSEVTPAKSFRPLPVQLEVPSSCDNFVGRLPLLALMESYLIPSLQVSQSLGHNTPTQKIVILHGAPGIGKTQLALEFARQSGSIYHHHFWVRADSQANIARSFHDAAIACELIDGRKEYSHSTSTAKFKEWMVSSGLRLLLVFDNVVDYSVLPSFVPPNYTGTILITSREPSPDSMMNLSRITTTALELEVTPFTVDETETFLRTALRDVNRYLENDTVQDLIEITGSSPIALDLAVVQMKAEGLTALEYLNKVKNTSASLSKSNGSNINRTTQALRIINLIATSRSLSAQTCAVCFALTCLDPVEIDESLLLAAGSSKVPLNDLPMTREYLKLCAKESARHGYTQYRDEHRLKWRHESLQDAFRATMTLQQQEEALQTTSLLLRARWPRQRRLISVLNGYWPEFDSLHTHVRHLSNLWISHCQENNSLDTLTQDTSFLDLLTRSIW
jgi:hypothetical protein